MSDTSASSASWAAKVGVDVSGIGAARIRRQLRRTLERVGYRVEDVDGFWTRFDEESEGLSADRPLVLADLADLVDRYLERDGPMWLASVRRSMCYFVALVRTEKDRRQAGYLDDLMRDSDMRIQVCDDWTRWDTVEESIADALGAMDPESLLEVRYEPVSDRLVVRFGDGFAATVSWDQLRLTERRHELIAESATVGFRGSTAEIRTTDGDVYDISAAALRAVSDAEFAEQVAASARAADLEFAAELGPRLKALRRAAGLTQAELGERTGMDDTAISRLENGRARPRVDTLERLARGLGVPVTGLLREAEAEVLEPA